MLSAALLTTTATCCWLTLLTLVCCEWVEISQHHYRPRKPYGNTSLLEHAWKQPPNRRIDIKAVDNPSHTTRLADVTALISPSHNTRITEVTPAINFKDFGDRKVTEAPKLNVQEINFKGVYPNQNTRVYDVSPTVNFRQDFGDRRVTDVPKLHVKETGLIHGKVEKVPSVGNVKRVQLSNTPIKSPNIKVNNVPNRRFGNEDNHGSKVPVSSEYSDELEIKSDIFKDSYEEVVSITPERNKQNNLKIKPTTGFMEDDDRNNPNYPNFNKNVTRKFKPEVNAIRFVKSEQKYQINSSDTSIEKVTNNPDKLTPGAPSLSKANKISDQVNIKDTKNEETSTNDYKYPDDNDDNTSEKTNEFKTTTLENLVKFMKVVTDTISKNARRGVNGKVKYLNELKDNLMQNIKYRIDSCWPDDSVRRRSRAATSRGHVEFPSSESALMTISFLTFAVFLIKLVLQVIQTYKNKAMIMAPVMVATAGRAFARKQDKH